MRPNKFLPHVTIRLFLLLPFLTLIVITSPAQGRSEFRVGPLVEPLVEAPKQAEFVDLAGEGATSGRSSVGEAIFRADSVEPLPTRNGRLRIGSDSTTFALVEPMYALALRVDAERVDAVVELTAMRGPHVIGSRLFTLDGKPRPGIEAARDGVIGLASLEAFDGVAVRVAHAPAGDSGVVIDAAWAERSAGGRDLNDIAIACNALFGVAYQVAFSLALVPSPFSEAFNATAYSSNLALKFCPTVFVPPPDKTAMPATGECHIELDQEHMFDKVVNVLGWTRQYESNWGDVGTPFVYQHNTEVDVALLYDTPTPSSAIRLDLDYWLQTASFEATDRIFMQCDDRNGSQEFSQLDGEGPSYRCPYVKDRTLRFPQGENTLLWRSYVRLSPIDFIYVPGLPSGAKGQPWSGLLFDVATELLVGAADAIFSGWRTRNTRDAFQTITVYDEDPPVIAPQPFSDGRITATLVGDVIEVTIEADEAGGVSRSRYAALLKSMYAVSDPCGRPTSMLPTFPTEALETFWPVSTSASPADFEITWTAQDPGPNRAGLPNETQATMRVEVVDTQPPVIVPPDDIVEVTTGTVSELGQPLVFDFVDLAPTVTNDAVLPIGFGLNFVTWTVTDASGNSDSAVQLVNVKASNLAPSPIAQTGTDRVEAVSFEPTPIRLRATDPDGDPLRFFIEDTPNDGFFIAPLYPYFVEDFRVEETVTDAELIEACTDPDGTGSEIDVQVPFPYNPIAITVTDDDRSYVVDEGFVQCNGGAAPSYTLRARIAVFGPDGALLDFERVVPDYDELKDVVLDRTLDRLFLTSHAGGGQSRLTVYDLDLNRIVDYRLVNLRRRDDGSSADDVTQARSAVTDANGLLYVLTEPGALIVLDGVLPPGFDCQVSCTVTPEFVDLLDPGEGGSTGGELALDSRGRLYASEYGRINRYRPSYIADDGLAYPGTLEGWMGRCDIDLAPGDQAVCDVGNRRTLGFSCTDATCAVDEAFNPEEQAICGALGIGGQPTWGCRPGQFRSRPKMDFDPQDVLYVADTGNARIQRFSTDGFFAGQAKSTCDGSCFVLGDFGNPQNVSVNASRFYVLDPATNLLHISLLTPFVEIGPDYADLEYQSTNDFACDDPADCIDGFRFSVSDGVRDPATGRPIRTAPADVEIGVVRNFRPPFATPGIAVVVDEDVPMAITLDGSDPDPLDALSFDLVDAPTHGTVQIVGNQATYTPDPDYYGTDTFSFAASDGMFASAPEVVTVTVAEVNDPPEVQVPEPAAAGVGFTYRLDTDFIDPDPDEQHLVVIDWGDGTVEPEVDAESDGPKLGQSGNGPGTISASHIYSSSGTYDVGICLTDRVTGGDGSEVPTAASLTACDSFPVTVIDGLDLVMEVWPSTERALPNEQFEILFRALNNPPSAGPPTTATGVELVVELPEGVAAGSIAVTGPGCALDGLIITCSAGTLQPGFAAFAEITARVNGAVAPGTPLLIEATVTSNEDDVRPNNEAAHLISVAPPADLYVDALGDAFLDKPDVNPGDGACASEDGVCTLRAAIEEANAQPGLRTVALGTGVYTLTEGRLDITDDLVLVGNGADSSIIDGDNDLALRINDASVALRIEDLTVSRGRIVVWPGDLVMRRARVTGGVADGFVGGAIFANDLIDLRDVVIDGNRAVSGGGIWAHAASHGVFENVTITGNRGGGLYLGGSDYTLNHVTIAGNSGDTGGASGIGGGALTVANTATVTMTGSILTGNYRPAGLLDVPRNCIVDDGATLISDGDNLFGDLDLCGLVPTAADLVVQDADDRLQPLRFADAQLPFIAPFADSPAIDAMLGPNCPPVDAIGTERPVDGDNDGFADCDIGAIELVPDLTPPQLDVSSTTIDFGEVSPGGSSAPRAVTLSNTGEQALAIDGIAITGPASADFSLPAAGNTCSGATLDEGQTCGFELVFTPLSDGIRTASVVIESGDPDGTRIIDLTGTSGVLFADGFEGK